MGRRKGSVNKVNVEELPKGVSFIKDGRSRPFKVRHRNLKVELFATAEDAVARKLELIKLEKSHGSSALTYSRELHADVTAARKVLPIGISHLKAAEFWQTHHAAVVVPLDQAIQEFIEKRRSQSIDPDGWTRHTKDINGRLQRFLRAFRQQEMSEITGEKVLHWLTSLKDDASRKKLGPRSVANYRTSLENFFNYAVRRKWMPESPLDGSLAEDLPTVRSSAKHPLSIAQADSFMQIIQAQVPEYAIHFGLRLFLGVRTEESQRFQWEWIQQDQGRIIVPAVLRDENDTIIGRGSKTGDDWAIYDVPPRFWELIKQWEKSQGLKVAELTGLIPKPTNNRWHGYAKPQGNRTPIPSLKQAIMDDLGLKSWPHNALRDTFCTLHMSAYLSAERTALVLKHRNSQTLWQSYLGTLVPKAEARRFFGDLSTD